MTSSQWREEAVGCPGPTRFLDALKNIFYSSRQISDDLFLSVVKFITIRSLEAPSRASSCPGNDIFSSFLPFPYFIFTKSDPLDAPRVDARGRRTVRTPSARPCIIFVYFLGVLLCPVYRVRLLRTLKPRNIKKLKT